MSKKKKAKAQEVPPEVIKALIDAMVPCIIASIMSQTVIVYGPYLSALAKLAVEGSRWSHGG